MKHNSLSSISVYAMGICLLLLTLPAASIASTKTITGDGVHVRAQPSVHSQILGKLYKGTKVITQGYSGSYRWTQIEAPVVAKVWVCRSYIRDGVVTATHLNVRSGPGSYYNILGAIDYGTSVDIIGGYRNWVQIKAPVGTTAFVYSAYVKDSGETTDPNQNQPNPGNIEQTPEPAEKPDKMPEVAAKPKAPDSGSTISSMATGPAPKKADPTATTDEPNAASKEETGGDDKDKKKPGFFKRLFGKEEE